MMRDIHESDACTRREIERRNPGTFNVDCEVHEWRAIGLLVSGDANSGNAILRETLIPETVKLAFSGNAGQFGFDLRQIKGAGQSLAKPVLDPLAGILIRPGNLDHLQFLRQWMPPGTTVGNILLPGHWVERVA